MEISLREQIKQLIHVHNPPLAALIRYGRGEAIKYFLTDVRQCFKEAGLLSGNCTQILEFWDILTSRARGIYNDIKLTYGRIGERLSLEYETHRTGKEPVYQAIESNLSGYDLLSQVGPQEQEKLLI